MILEQSLRVQGGAGIMSILDARGKEGNQNLPFLTHAQVSIIKLTFINLVSNRLDKITAYDQY